MAMSSAEEKHPIVSHLEIIEERLGKIEKALGIDDTPRRVLPPRTIVLIVVLLVLGFSFFFGLMHMFNKLFSALPV